MKHNMLYITVSMKTHIWDKNLIGLGTLKFWDNLITQVVLKKLMYIIYNF